MASWCLTGLWFICLGISLSVEFLFRSVPEIGLRDEPVNHQQLVRCYAATSMLMGTPPTLKDISSKQCPTSTHKSRPIVGHIWFEVLLTRVVSEFRWFRWRKVQCLWRVFVCLCLPGIRGCTKTIWPECITGVAAIDGMLLLMVQKSHSQPPGMLKPYKSI